MFSLGATCSPDLGPRVPSKLWSSGCFCEPMKAFPIVLRKNLWLAALLWALSELEGSVKLLAGPLGCFWGFPLLYSNYWLMKRIDTRYIPCPHEYNRGRSDEKPLK